MFFLGIGDAGNDDASPLTSDMLSRNRNSRKMGSPLAEPKLPENGPGGWQVRDEFLSEPNGHVMTMEFYPVFVII